MEIIQNRTDNRWSAETDSFDTHGWQNKNEEDKKKRWRDELQQHLGQCELVHESKKPIYIYFGKYLAITASSTLSVIKKIHLKVLQIISNQ